MRPIVLALPMAMAASAASAQALDQSSTMKAMEYANRYIGPHTQSFAVSGAAHRASSSAEVTIKNEQITNRTAASHSGMAFSDTYGHGSGKATATGGAVSMGAATMGNLPASSSASQAVSQTSQSTSFTSSQARAVR